MTTGAGDRSPGRRAPGCQATTGFRQGAGRVRSGPYIFGRELSQTLGFINAFLQRFVAYCLPLSTSQTAAINAALATVLGVVTAYVVAENRLVRAIIDLGQASFTLTLAFGAHLSQNQITLSWPRWLPCARGGRPGERHPSRFGVELATCRQVIKSRCQRRIVSGRTSSRRNASCGTRCGS